MTATLRNPGSVGPVYDPNSFTPQALGPINATSAEAGEKLRPKSTLVLVLFNAKVPSPQIRIGDSFPYDSEKPAAFDSGLDDLGGYNPGIW